MSADVVIRFLADTNQLRAGVSQVEGTGNKIKKWAAGVGAAVGAAFVTKQVLDMVGAASDLNETVSKTQTVFGRSAGKVLDWSKTSATALGLSKQQALEAAGTYGNLAVALGLPQPKAAAMSTKLVQLASDLSSFNNVPVDEVLQALQSGLVGETEPLRKFGVSLSAARVEAEALRLGLAKAPVDMTKVELALKRTALAQDKARLATAKYGKDSGQARSAVLASTGAEQALQKVMAGGKVTLSAAAKAQATYSLIMKDSKVAQGDFARTSDGLANKQRIMSAKWKDLQAKIGGFFLPVMSAAVDLVIRAVDVFANFGAVIDSVTGFVRDNALVLGLLAGALLVALAPAIASAIAYGILATQIAILTVITKAQAIAQGLLNAVMSANPIFLVVAAIVALVAILILAYQKVGWFRAAVDAMGRAAVIAFAWIVNAAKAVWQWIKTNWPLLLAVLVGPIGLAVLAIVRNWDRIKAGAAAVVDWLRSTWHTITEILTAPFRAAWESISGVIGKVRGAISSAISFASSVAGRIADILKAPINAVIRGWNSIEFKVPEMDPLGKFGPSIGGQTIGLPDIPQLAGGGYITRTGLAVVHRGETVTNNAGGITIEHLEVHAGAGANGYEIGKAIVDRIRSYETVAGTGWRRAPSGRSA